jgi:hypothetical protein
MAIRETLLGAARRGSRLSRKETWLCGQALAPWLHRFHAKFDLEFIIVFSVFAFL